MNKVGMVVYEGGGIIASVVPSGLLGWHARVEDHNHEKGFLLHEAGWHLTMKGAATAAMIEGVTEHAKRQGAR